MVTVQLWKLWGTWGIIHTGSLLLIWAGASDIIAPIALYLLLGAVICAFFSIGVVAWRFILRPFAQRQPR